MKAFLRVAAAILLVTGAATVITPSAAQAVVPPYKGCRYSGSNPTIDVKVNFTSTVYRSALTSAMNRWNTTNAPGSFRYATTGANINAWQLYSSEDFWARVTYVCSGGYYARTIDFDFNSRLMDPMSTREKWVVAVHELGHAYGLAHVDMTCGSPSVMMQGRLKFSCTGTPPWPDDVTGVHNIY